MSDFASRYVTLSDPLHAFDDAYYEVTRLLATVLDPDWVCSHVAALCDEYAAIAEASSEPAPERGSDHVVAFAEAGRRARHAFYQEDFLETELLTPLGIMPGAVVVQHVVNELVSHAWDIAHAIGADLTLDDDLLERVQLSWRVFFETHGRPSHNFEPERPAPPGASSADRLAAFLGRPIG